MSLELTSYEGEIVFLYKVDVETFFNNLYDDEVIWSPIFHFFNFPWRIAVKPARKDQGEKELEEIIIMIDRKGPKFGPCDVDVQISLLRQDSSEPSLKGNRFCFSFMEKDYDEHDDQCIDYLQNNQTYELSLGGQELCSFIVGEEEENENRKMTLEICMWAKQKIFEKKDELGGTLGNLLESGDGADVTFVIKDDSSQSSRIRAHKLILSARCPVFAAMFTAKMKESATNEVEIDDMGPITLKLFLRHIYTNEKSFPDEIQLDIQICKELVNAGDKYNLTNLKEIAGESLSEMATYENAIDLLKFVKLHKAEVGIGWMSSYVRENISKIIAAM